MLLREDYLSDEHLSEGHNLDDETLLDLIVNSIFFDDNTYLQQELAKEFPTEDSIYKMFSQDEIIDQIVADKEIDKKLAQKAFSDFMNKHYGVQQ